MAKSTEAKGAVGSRQWAVRSLIGRMFAVHLLFSLFVSAAILTACLNLRAESAASRNKEGNRLYAQGKYEDAEKAYLEAQAKDPGKPEVLYNLGNSLIKQKKYDQGIQSLRQSISKGNAGIEENGWYNTGNALFSKGDFKGSAEAFIQALRLDPADKDAKHNLELALMRLEQKEQKQSNEGQKQDQSQAGRNGNKQPPGKAPNGSGNPKDQNEPAKQQARPTDQREGSVSKEQAIQILDAVQSRETEEQRKLLEHRARERSGSKDW